MTRGTSVKKKKKKKILIRSNVVTSEVVNKREVDSVGKWKLQTQRLERKGKNTKK